MLNRIILVIFITILLTGCSRNKELEERDYVMAIGIDGTRDYDVYVAIAKPSLGSDNKKLEEAVFKGKGKTINEALHDINIRTKGNLYLGHNKIIVLGNDFKNYKEFIEYISDNIEISRDTAVVRAGNPEEILKAKNNDVNASDYIYEYYNEINKVDLDKVMDYYNKGEEFELPNVKVEKDNIVIENVKSK